MKLKTKLIWGFGTILGLTTFLSIILLVILGQQNKDMYDIVKNRYEKYKLATVIASENNAIARQARDFLLSPDSFTEDNIESIRQSSLAVSTSTATLMRLADKDQEIELITRIQSAHQAYVDGVEQAIVLIKDGKHDEANYVIVEGVKKDRHEILNSTERLKEMEHGAMVDVLSESTKTYRLAIQFTIILFASTIAIGILVMFWVIGGFMRSINRVSTAIKSVSEGYTDSLPRIEVISNDEFGQISVAFNTMAQAIEDHTHQEEEFRTLLQEQNWLETKLSEIMTQLQEVQEVETLGNLLITTLTPIVNAQYGVFYLVEGDTRIQTKYLKKLAAYAANPDFDAKGYFALGEGLVGQCAADHRQILLEDIPDEYIRSGLGSGTPKNLLVLPIEFEGRVRAVLEIASLHEFMPLHLTLLDRLSQSIGISIDNIVHQTQVKKLLEQSQSLTEELQSQSEELQLQHEEMRTINEQLERQINESEQKTRELEITKKALEEKAEQLAINSQYKSEFLANMSHELRTPLNSMLILAQILAENKEHNLTPKQVEHAQAIHLSGRDLLNLINDVLDLAKVESGKMEITPTNVDLQAFSHYIENQFRPVADRKGIDFKVELANNLPQTLFTDEHRVMQIVKNLLSNAFKFTDKGEVRLTMRLPHGLDYRKPNVPHNTALVIAVSDTGIGIAKDKQTIIFEAFRQADGTTSRKYGGTGLGLSISREIAHQLGGAIGVDSSEGKGSTFSLYLPAYSLESPESYSHTPGPHSSDHMDSALTTDSTAHKPTISTARKPTIAPPLSESQATNSASAVTPASPTKTPPAAPAKGDTESNRSVSSKSQAMLAGKNVLIVDDDMRNIFALTTLLEDHGVNVIIAENGREALELLPTHPEIELILMDIMMPEMDGFTAIKTIRQIPELAELPIIALTAKAMKLDREKCLEAGASDYISKPINIDQLLSLMHVWLYPSAKPKGGDASDQTNT